MPLAFALECRSHLELEAKSWADKLKAESWDKLRSLDAHFWCETGNNFKGTKSHAQRNTTSYCNSCSYCMVRSEECLYAVVSCGLTLAQLSLSFLSTKKCNVLLPHLKKCKKKNETVQNIRIEWITMITIPRAPLVSRQLPQWKCSALHGTNHDPTNLAALLSELSVANKNDKSHRSTFKSQFFAFNIPYNFWQKGISVKW